MATTFGVLKPGHIISSEDDDEDKYIEVAFRGSYTYWKNELAALLPDQTLVYALDNVCCDIKTIADLKKIINK